jgi:hypothetical protein
VKQVVHGKTAHPDSKKYVADRVWIFVKNNLFQKVKFVTKEKALREVMTAVEVSEQINDPRRKQAFFNVYKGVVMDALNVRRSLCDQTGGKIVHWYLTSCCNDLQPGEMPSFFSENALLKLHQAGSGEELKAFLWFYGEFLECVSGKECGVIRSITAWYHQQPVATQNNQW